jgi:hypothetical protein
MTRITPVNIDVNTIKLETSPLNKEAINPATTRLFPMDCMLEFIVL